MSRIEACLRACADKGEKALIVFVTAGDPSLDDLPAILSAIEEGGADLIEVGIPFSDPIADGPVIQASSQRALERHATPGLILDVLATSQGAVPRVVMGYANTAWSLGFEKFARDLRHAGVDGVILSDLSPEEAGPWIEAARKNDLDTIFLTAPTSTPERLQAACMSCSGFVYAIARTGVTGRSTDGYEDAEHLVRRLREETSLPVCVGFGISTPDQVRQVAEFCDGVIVGSTVVQWIANNYKGIHCRNELVELIANLKAATKQ